MNPEIIQYKNEFENKIKSITQLINELRLKLEGEVYSTLTNQEIKQLIKEFTSDPDYKLKRKKQWFQDYYIEHKQILNNKIKCDLCGGSYTRVSFNAHKLSIKLLKNMNY